jgi:hypothetical protein
VEVVVQGGEKTRLSIKDVWEGFRRFGHWTVSINKGTDRQYPGALKSMD